MSQYHYLVSDAFENAASRLAQSLDSFGDTSEAHAKTMEQVVDQLRDLFSGDRLTIRDQIAVGAMQAIANGDYETFDAMARDAYKMADAMIEARKGGAT